MDFYEPVKQGSPQPDGEAARVSPHIVQRVV